MSSQEHSNANKPKQRATINQVADLAGVSIKTVSRVFNNEPNVRPATKEKVVEAARELDYRPNLSARRLAANRSFLIGLLYDNPNSDYVTAIQDGALEVCRNSGYHLLIHPCRPDDPDFLEQILGLYRQSTVDGFILTQPLSENEQLINALAEGGIQFVRIGQKKVSVAPHISVDDRSATHHIIEHLIEFGHRRIGFIMGHPEHGSSHERLAGYRKAMSDHGLHVEDDWIEQGLYNFESGYSCARRLLSLKPRLTAIFASNDHMAMGVLTAAHEKNIQVPGDLSVCGFDDTPMARFAWPPLTTLRQPIKQVARLATELLIKRIKEGDDAEITYRLHSELVRRDSTGPVPEKK